MNVVTISYDLESLFTDQPYHVVDWESVYHGAAHGLATIVYTPLHTKFHVSQDDSR